MCYPCTMCNGCGKLNPDSPLYTPPIAVTCLDCGGTVDATTGKCDTCGAQVLSALGKPGQ